MKLYIAYPEHKGEGVYHLLTENGEYLNQHYCSHIIYAKGDLISNRPDRIAKYKERFGEIEILFLGDDDMTKDKLIELNKKWIEEQLGRSEDENRY